MKVNNFHFSSKGANMKIDKYEKDKGNNYNIYLSNGEVLTLDERVITENTLLLKKEIDDNLYKKLIKDNEIISLYNSAIKYINIRLRSIKEIKDYLSKKTLDSSLISSTIDRLVLNKYLDDDRFTKAFIKDKLRFTNMGDYKIRKELERLGVDREIIDNNISNISDEIIYDKISTMIKKDTIKYKKYTGRELKNKIYNHLINQGYSKDRVISCLNNYSF